VLAVAARTLPEELDEEEEESSNITFTLCVKFAVYNFHYFMQWLA